MPTSDKVDKVEKLRRVRIVQEKLLEGANSSDLAHSIVKQWNLSERQAKRYLSEAYEGFYSQTEKSIEQAKGFHLEARRKLYKRHADTRPSFALEVLKDMAKIEGAYAPIKIDHTTDGQPLDLSGLSLEEKTKILELLRSNEK